VVSSGEENQTALRAFAARWQDYSRTEKAEAQTFRNGLVDCGTDRHAAGMLFEEAGWPASLAQDDDELVRRLTALSREIAEGGRAYAPFDHLGLGLPGDDHSRLHECVAGIALPPRSVRLPRTVAAVAFWRAQPPSSQSHLPPEADRSRREQVRPVHVEHARAG
jgi:hypothetical protein